MAATNVYARYTRIPESSGPGGPGRPIEIGILEDSDANSGNFRLLGGWYAVEVIGDTFGTVTLQKLGPDDTTFLTAATAFSASGMSVVQLPFGTYRFALG